MVDGALQLLPVHPVEEEVADDQEAAAAVWDKQESSEDNSNSSSVAVPAKESNTSFNFQDEQEQEQEQQQEHCCWDWDGAEAEDMDATRSVKLARKYSGSMQSEESALLDREQAQAQRQSSPATLQAFQSGGQHSESSAAYFLWPPSNRLNGTAEERAAYFGSAQKHTQAAAEAAAAAAAAAAEAVEAEAEAAVAVAVAVEAEPSSLDRSGGGGAQGHQATTLLELMTIRAFHSKMLRRYSLGTAIGFRIRQGRLTSIPAILVFVARKVHKQWLLDVQRLPSVLEGPGGVWCDVDVVEFSYYGAPAATPKEQLYTELVEGLRGSDQTIGSGSQVASQETYGTLGAIVKSRTGSHQVGFLTNRHVAVDLDYPNQKMFHPLPPNLGPGVYLGAVERATSFITDDLWYGIFAGMNPETFVRADGAFIPFAEGFNISNVTTTVKGVGDMGEVLCIDLQAPIGSLVGKQVVKVGRSSGLTRGTIMAYALEYNDEKGICFFTDFLVVGENKQSFDLEGDSGSLILVIGENDEKPRPVGIIWGGTANRGRLKLKNGSGPENWTSGVDLGRLLDLLQLDLITSADALKEGIEEQKRWSSTSPRIDSPMGESSPGGYRIGPLPAPPAPEKEKAEETCQHLQLKAEETCQHLQLEDISKLDLGFQRKNEEGSLFQQSEYGPRLAEASTSVEHQFLRRDVHMSMGHQGPTTRNLECENLSALRDGKDESGEDISIGLHLGDREAKRKRPNP